VEEAPVLVAEGDGLEPLRRVRQQYYNHAYKITRRRTDPETGQLPVEYHAIVAWYQQQGDNIGTMIPEDKHGNSQVEALPQDGGGSGKDVCGSSQGDLGDSISNAIGSTDLGTGTVSAEEPVAALPRPSEDEVGSGPAEHLEDGGTTEPIRDGQAS